MTNYSLTAYTNVLGSHEKVKVLHTIPSVAESWERSVALQGGDWVGHFRLSGLPFRELIDIFNNWLGYDIQENSSGVRWGGMVYEMELHHNLIRRISYDPMVNRLVGIYSEQIEDGGFETGGGSPFQFWTPEPSFGGSVNIEATSIHDGAQAAKLTAAAADTSLYQSVSVDEQTNYRLVFYTRGASSTAGEYSVYDASNLADIIASTTTDVDGDDYRRVEEEFTTPAGCELIEVRFTALAPSHIAYFDTVSLVKLKNGEPSDSTTGFKSKQNESSISQHGLKEAIIRGKTFNEVQQSATSQLAQYAWPVVEREEGQADDEPYLEVMVVGYAFTLKWVLNTIQLYGGHVYATALLPQLLALCQFVSSQVIANSGVQVSWEDDPAATVRDMINLITDAGDGAGNPWRLHVNHARLATYEAISNEPVYHLRGGKFYEAGGSRYTPVASRQLRPGVVRDLDYPVSGAEPGSWFQDRRDFLLDEISVAANGSLRWGIAEV